MGPLLHVAHRHGGADRGRGGGIVVGRRVAIGLLRGGGLLLLRRSRLLHTGAHEDHLFDRGLLDVRGEGVRRNHLVAGTGDEVRLFQNAFLTLGLHLLGALRQIGGLLLHRVEWDHRLLGLHLGACARDFDRRRFVDRRTQVGLHGVARFERDVAGVKHGLHVGEVGAQHGAGLAVDRDVDVRGFAVQCLTGIATGGGVGIGHGIRGRLRCRLGLRVGIDAARGQAAGHNQTNACGRRGNAHPLTLAQRSKGGVVRLVMGRHYAPLTTSTNPRRYCSWLIRAAKNAHSQGARQPRCARPHPWPPPECTLQPIIPCTALLI